MPKPIIVLKVETALYGNDYQKLRNIEEVFARRFEREYYLIAVPIYRQTEEPVTLEVHYDKNFTDTKFTQLKEHITNLVNDLGTEVEMDRPTLMKLLHDHPPMLSESQIDMWKAYGSFNKFAVNQTWEWNQEKLDSMDSHSLLRLHNEIESFK